MVWRPHAYVLIRNRDHLALKIPEPDLAKGMHWLQSTWRYGLIASGKKVGTTSKADTKLYYSRMRQFWAK